MKSLIFLIAITFIFPAHAQVKPEECAPDTLIDPLWRNVKEAGKRLPSNESNCGVISGSDDYWYCMALEQKNCGLIRSSKDYWNCEALLQKNCSLTNGDNYWFCESLLQKACGLNKGSQDYWLCESLLQENCALSTGKNYWFCEGMKKTIKEILKPKKIIIPKAIPYVI